MAPPRALTIIKIAFIAVVGVVVVAICSVNRAHFGNLSGVPWVVPIVLAVLAVWMILLERTRFGRYIYAIGGNPELRVAPASGSPASGPWPLSSAP